MKKTFISRILIILLAASLFTCTTEEVSTRTYPRVHTDGMGTITSDGVLMKGEIVFSSTQILDHGFLWSSNSFPEMDKAEKILLGAKDGIGKFEAQVNRNLQEGKTYSMRAYARSANNLVYGQVLKFVSQGCKNKPILSDFTPKQGTTEDIITIKGDFFSTVLTNSEVSFGELKVDIISAVQNEIKIRIPITTNTGSVNITVISNGNQTVSTEKFILKGARIDDFTPKVGVIASTLIEMTGADYGTDKASIKVTFAGKVCEIIELTDTRVVFRLPPDAPVGEFSLVVEKGGKTNSSSLTCKSVSPWTLEYTKLDTWYSLKGGMVVINNKAYIRTRASTISHDCCYPLWWEYSPATNSFESKANFIGPESSEVMGLSIGSKGYLINSSMYEYDPSSNSWSSATPPLEDISRSLGFEANGLGYVVGGFLRASVKVYNPSLATWSKLNPIFDIDPYQADQCGFIINNNIFIGLGGTAGFGAFNSKFWRYDISANRWSEVKSFPGKLRVDAISFAINGKGYVGGGSDPYSLTLHDFWEYDPSFDTWTRKADLPSTVKGMNSFSDNAKGYVTSGYLPDWTIWSYDPNK